MNTNPYLPPTDPASQGPDNEPVEGCDMVQVSPSEQVAFVTDWSREGISAKRKRSHDRWVLIALTLLVLMGPPLAILNEMGIPPFGDGALVVTALPSPIKSS